MTSSAVALRECPCHGESSRQVDGGSVLCPVCVSHALYTPLERHRQALEERNTARKDCQVQLQACPGQEIAELAYESRELRERLASLRQQCGSLAVRVAAHVVENDERQAQQEDPTLVQQHLDRLQDSLCNVDSGSLSQAILSSTHQVKRLRFQWALQTFAMHRLVVEGPEERPTLRQKHARGIGKIGGLPLPHAGPELYGVLPPQELQSALRLVASLTCTLARCLGIVLPHPIRLQPNGPNGDITQNPLEAQTSPPVISPLTTPTTTAAATSSSTTSLLSIVETTSSWGRKALARATGHKKPAARMLSPSMDSTAVSRRLHHAASAVLAEDASGKTLYSLGCQEEFGIGLQLLQNDIVALCIRAGVPVATLWPAEAVLLNLHALWIFCQDQVKV